MVEEQRIVLFHLLVEHDMTEPRLAQIRTQKKRKLILIGGQPVGLLAAMQVPRLITYDLNKSPNYTPTCNMHPMERRQQVLLGIGR